MATGLLFERDQVAEVDDWSPTLPKIGRSALLWVDLEDPTDEDVAKLVAAFDLEGVTAEDLRRSHSTPRLVDHGDYLHVTAIGLSDDREAARVDCLVSERWVVTVHEKPVEVVDRFRNVAEGSGSIGRMHGLGFAAHLLEWALSSYFDAFESLEHDLEEIDAKAMTGTVSSTEEVLADLVEKRREVGRLRRSLVSHREVVLSLTRPELEALATAESAEMFSGLRERLEEAVQASRDTRESIVGSFDVLLASTTRRTNEIMKVLTLASVLLLPGALIAGIMGMNFKVGIFETAAFFWVVLGIIVAIVLASLGVARMRAWI